LVATLLKGNEIETFCEKVKTLITYFKQSIIADELQKYETKK